MYDKGERLGKVKTVLILLCVFIYAFCLVFELEGSMGNLRTLINYSNNKFVKTQLL